MPATFTRATQVEPERRDTGIGGKPPVDRRPTGGGGEGDNWDNRPSGRRGPRELLTRYRLAMTFALAGDMMFFVALVSAFFVRQASGHIDASNNYISDWHPLSIPPILWLNTAILVLSSFTIEMARRQLFREIDVMEEWFGLGKPTVRRATPWLVASMVLGLIFVAGQWIAWQQLYGPVLFDQPEQQLLLPDHRNARHPPGARPDGDRLRRRRAPLAKAHRVPSDRGRLHCLVLARDGGFLDIPLRAAGLFPMRRPLSLLALIAAFALAPMLRAQGCSLCRDATAGSAPQTRKAFRLAIPLLGSPAIAIFAGSLVLAKKIQPGRVP
jgi:cytochrome c oxidase subunit 3